MDMFVLNEKHGSQSKNKKKKKRGQFNPNPGPSPSTSSNSGSSTSGSSTSSSNTGNSGSSTGSGGFNPNPGPNLGYGSGNIHGFQTTSYKNPTIYTNLKGRKFNINQDIYALDPNDPDFEKDAREYYEHESKFAMNPKFFDSWKKNWEETGRQDALSVDEIIDEMKKGDPHCRQASIALHKAATSKDTGFITKVLAKLHVLARKYEVKYSNTKVNGPKTLFQKMIYYIGKAIRYLTARLYKFMHKNEAYVLNIGTLKQVVTE